MVNAGSDLISCLARYGEVITVVFDFSHNVGLH